MNKSNELYIRLLKTDEYKNLIAYMMDIGYSREEARKKIKSYACGDQYEGLDAFVRFHIPCHKKLGGWLRGKRFINSKVHKELYD